MSHYRLLRSYIFSPRLGGSTTTTTRHFAAWEQTTTHFNPHGQHSHPLLAASISLNNSPVIRPIPNRLSSPPESHTSLLGGSVVPPSIKLGELSESSHVSSSAAAAQCNFFFFLFARTDRTTARGVQIKSCYTPFLCLN